jgi:hypothetical protein
MAFITTVHIGRDGSGTNQVPTTADSKLGPTDASPRGANPNRASPNHAHPKGDTKRSALMNQPMPCY